MSHAKNGFSKELVSMPSFVIALTEGLPLFTAYLAFPAVNQRSVAYAVWKF